MFFISTTGWDAGIELPHMAMRSADSHQAKSTKLAIPYRLRKDGNSNRTSSFN